jgi:type I restriction enzyme R subunit
VDECHRSIYQKWKQVLDYYDAFIIGLTATPSLHTIGFFERNLVMEYGHERAVADGVNVGYDVYRIQTRITHEGSSIPAKQYVDKRDRETRDRRWEQLDEPVEYTASELDRDVVSVDQIRTIIESFKDSLPVIFPDRGIVPKTVVFAKDDSHADDIVLMIREVFNKPNEFCRKITYRSSGDPDDLIRQFRNQYNPRIVVSVDMISTGTDIKPVECLLFMRDVKSRTYFDQMKGRGTRVISSTDLLQVTPDAEKKTRFVLIDAVGVTESLKTDTRSLERKPSISFEKLLEQVSKGKRDTDTLQTMVNRLSRLFQKLGGEDRNELAEAAGKSLRGITNDLLDAIDPDVILEKAQ